MPKNFKFNLATEETIEQEEKRIFGYIAPKDLFNGKVKEGDIYSKTNNADNTYGVICGKDYKYTLPSEIVETWEPEYYPKFKVGDHVIVLNNKIANEEGGCNDSNFYQIGKIGKITKISSEKFFLNPKIRWIFIDNHYDGITDSFVKLVSCIEIEQSRRIALTLKSGINLFVGKSDVLIEREKVSFEFFEHLLSAFTLNPFDLLTSDSDKYIDFFNGVLKFKITLEELMELKQYFPKTRK